MTKETKSPNTDVLVDIGMKSIPIMRTFFRNPEWLKPRKKADNTTVTACDLELDAMAHDIMKNYPDVAVISEETKASRRSEVEFIVDPLDGTSSFKHQLAGSVFAAAVTRNGLIERSIVVDALHWGGPRYFLADSEGTRLFEGVDTDGGRMPSAPSEWLDPQKLHVSEKSRGTVAFWDWPKSSVPIFPIMDRLKKLGFSFAQIGSVSHAAALVAQGEYVGVVFPGKNIWDMAPGELLVREAGGTVTDLFGKPIDYTKLQADGAIFSNGVVHQDLLDAVQSEIFSSVCSA